MALTDDNFSQVELRMLYRFAEERSVSSEDLDKILLTEPYELSIPDLIEKRIEYLYDLACMVWADGVVTDDEVATLQKYCRKFEFLDSNINELAIYLLESAKSGKTKSVILSELNDSK